MEVLKHKIRLVKKTDLKPLANIYRDIYNAEGEDWTIEKAIEYLEYFYKHQKDLFFVAEINNKTVGSISGIIKAFCSGYDLWDVEIFISPEFHNVGIGKELMIKLIQTSIEKYNIVSVQGIADSNKDFPMRWYNKIGWKRTKWAHIYGDAREMLKNLTTKN